MLRHWTATRSTALDAAVIHCKSCILPMTTLATDWHCSLAVQFASFRVSLERLFQIAKAGTMEVETEFSEYS